jgi:hypothetical protein
MRRKQRRSLSVDGSQIKIKSAGRRKIEAFERLATHIHQASFETDRWWYDEKANRRALQACRLTKTELAGVVADLVLEGRAYFGHNRYFSFLKLVNWAEELEDYGVGRSLAGQMWVFSKLGGYLIRSVDEGPQFTWIFPDVRLAFVAGQPWKTGEWMLLEEVNWDELGPRSLPED